MPDHFSQDHPHRNSAKCAAVHAVAVETKKKGRAPTFFKTVYTLDEFAQPGVPEHHDIARSDPAQKDGDFRNEHKIPILVERVKASPGNLQEL